MKQDFLVALGDALRSLSDPGEIVAATTRALGERLGAQRVVYAEVDGAEAFATTQGDWTDGTAVPLPARIRLADFGPKLIGLLKKGGTLCVDDTRTHAATADGFAALEAIEVRALVSVALVKDGRFVASLNVHSGTPRIWTSAEADLIEAVAERTWDVLARARAIRTLVDREHELQMLTDALPVLISYVDADRRYRFINRAYEDWFSHRRADILGKRVVEVIGDAAYAAVAPYMDRVLAGERVRFEQLMPYADAPSRYIEVEYVPREGAVGSVEGFYALIKDVSEREAAQSALRAREARLSFLDRLGAETAPLAEADAVLATTTRMLGEHLGLSVCAYADMDEDENGFTIRGDWAAPGSTSIVGHYSLADFGKLAVKNLSAGQPLVVNDNLRELAPEEAATFQDIGIAATICMPLVKEGRLTALMAIHDRVPRVWTEDELSLLREVTDRSWAHVERVGAVAELRALNADLERQVIERTLARGRTWQVSPDLMGALNPQGYFETSNPAWRTVLGWSEMEVARMSIWELLHPDDLERTREGFALTQKGQPAIQFPNRYRCKDGTYRWISWVGVPDDGMVYCTGRDITAEKEKEIELAARTAERDRLWRNSQDLLVVIDQKGTFQATNPAATRILGWMPEDMVGRTLFDFVHPDDVEATSGALEHARARELPMFENRYRHKDGGFRWLSWVAAPEGELIFATARHITAEKEAAAELAVAQEALRQSQKLEAMGQLTGGVAHDFNNLVQGMTGALALLQRRVDEGRIAELPRYIDMALTGAQRAAALTQRLLAFARRQPLDPRPVDANRLVTAMEELLRQTLGPATELKMILASELRPALCDSNQLENAILNLAINARDAMPDGGRLTVETANIELDAACAQAAEVRPGHYVSVSVTDTGIGMPPEIVAQVFEPFYTTKPTGHGTGLGLSMLFGFVKQSGGHVQVDSEPGRGTTMRLYLPCPLGEAAPEHRTTVPALLAPAAFATAGVTVLVVEDEAMIRILVVEAMEGIGCRVLEVADGPAGLDILHSDARIDLLLTDVGLPGGMNGRQLADAARERRPGLPVLFMTGYAHDAALGNGAALEPGMELMNKPFALDALAAKVRSLLKS